MWLFTPTSNHNNSSIKIMKRLTRHDNKSLSFEGIRSQIIMMMTMIMIMMIFKFTKGNVIGISNYPNDHILDFARFKKIKPLSH